MKHSFGIIPTEAQGPSGKITRRTKRASANPNHHLWNNNGTWFIHYTRYPTPFTAERMRYSLKTRDLAVARLRRDHLLQIREDCRMSKGEASS